jgi:hypothetical protein
MSMIVGAAGNLGTDRSVSIHPKWHKHAVDARVPIAAVLVAACLQVPSDPAPLTTNKQ